MPEIPSTGRSVESLGSRSWCAGVVDYDDIKGHGILLNGPWFASKGGL